ncbi:hypothetical protein BT93_C1193 [Corymbia citriodora subsp. variegata]|nr:hypothetical protein BT93_C1193 [Corymbia citriodora subsp. variegata]
MSCQSPKLIIYFGVNRGDGFRNVCFNILCPGFVQIHETLTPNSPITPTSTYGGQQYEIRVHVGQDPHRGNWWLVVNGDIAVGYWPKELFIDLGDGGKRGSWRGEGFSRRTKFCPSLRGGYTSDVEYDHAAFGPPDLLHDGIQQEPNSDGRVRAFDKSKVNGLKK